MRQHMTAQAAAHQRQSPIHPTDSEHNLGPFLMFYAIIETRHAVDQIVHEFAGCRSLSDFISRIDKLDDVSLVGVGFFAYLLYLLFKRHSAELKERFRRLLRDFVG